MRLVLGILAILLGVALLLAGGAVLTAEQTVRTLGDEAEGRIPSTLTFDADEAKYGIVLFVNATDHDVLDTRCAVVLADGSERSIRGDVQTFAVTSGHKSVGEFEAVAGSTSVSCRFVDDEPHGQRFAVTRIRTGVRTFALVLLGLGLAAVLGGVALIVSRSMRRQG